MPEPETDATHKSTPSKRASSGVQGGLYQIDVLTVVMLNALGKLKDWTLETENALLGKFDDIVVKSHGEYVLIQAKHKEKPSKKITYEGLFATSSSAPFSLIQYFISFQEIRNQYDIKDAIICTNIGINIENRVPSRNNVISERIISKHNASTEHILYSKNVEINYYTFEEDFLEELKKEILEYLRIKGLKICVKDNDLRYFLSKLQIVPNFNQECLEAVGKEAISQIPLAKNLDAKSAFKYVTKKVGDWYKAKEHRMPLEPVNANAYFCEIISRDFQGLLKEYNVVWECNELRSIFQQSDINVFHIIPQKTCLLDVTKVFQQLQFNASKITYLVLNQKQSIEMQRDIIQVFSKINQYVFLVVVFPVHANDELLEVLYTVITNSQNKKIIVIAEADDKLANKIKSRIDNFRTYSDNIMFDNLSSSTRENFLKRTVVFQGVRMSLENVMVSGAGDIHDSADLNYIVDREMLEKLSKEDEEITIWGKVEHLDENIKHYYINRKFIRDGQHYSEEQLCQRGEKVVLISAVPGMGKSTVLGSLATAVKRNYPHLWVIRVNLNSYSDILKKYSKKKPQQIPITELLESQEGTKLKSEFEKRLFHVDNKVVLMVDAVDEVSPNYFDIVIHLLEDCMKTRNIDRIFITTRPHVCQNLEKRLDVIAYKLEPYSGIDQRIFLAAYWTKHLDLQEEKLKEKCRHYAALLIQNLSKKLRDRQGSLTENPLHLRMLAELFQQQNDPSDELQSWDGCREYLSSEKMETSLPGNFSSLFHLITRFINKKRDIFVEDKGNSRGNVLTEDALTKIFNKCDEFHCILAMQIILPADEEELSTLYRNKRETLSSVKDDLLKVGIVQQTNGELQFIHRTFAEYYVAKHLLTELKQKTDNQQLTDFFLIKILSANQYHAVRTMLDDFLSVDLSSYLNVTQNLAGYLLSKFGPTAYIKSKKCLSSPIHTAAIEARLYLIKLLVGQLVESSSLGGCQVVQVNAANWLIARDYNDNTALHYAVKNGHLDVVKFLVEHYADINIISLKDGKGLTVLHCAVRRGNLEVIKFLMDKLAGVKWFQIKNSDGFTVLHYAAMGGVLQFIDFIMKQYGGSSWIDGKDDDLLQHHYKADVPSSARRDNLKIVVFLVEQLIDANWIGIRDDRGATMLHYAAAGGNLPVVKFLIKQLGDINWIDDRDHEGRTILHYAAMGLINFEIFSNFQVVLFLIKQLGNNDWISIRDNKGLTVLHYATKASNLQIVGFLINNVNNDVINIKDDDGLTVLHYAVMGYKVPFSEVAGDVELVSFLMQQLAGINWINIRDYQGRTVLHYAAKTGYLEVVDFLMKQYPCDWIDIKDNDGLTLLHYAAMRDSPIVIDFLMKRLHYTYDWINITDGVGSTALHVAAQENEWRIVNFLLDRLGRMDPNSQKYVKPLTIKDVYGIPHTFDLGNLDTVALSCMVKDMKIILENHGVRLSRQDDTKYFIMPNFDTATGVVVAVDEDGNYYDYYDVSC